LLKRINERQKKKSSHKSAAQLDLVTVSLLHHIKRRTVQEIVTLAAEDRSSMAEKIQKTIAPYSLKARKLIPNFLTTLSEVFPSFLPSFVNTKVYIHCHLYSNAIL
jgi:hypothetical protein